ncbi:TonB-dependent receptor [Sterolibacterium denitrificans]|uniref:TonB-dependent receptor n=3 Tax=Sterolibacterium denitrificans TaxID=157592 RepID=A0A656ZCW4_9PROT|nr:TonB-dependent receptor [Sterolibacterium denitrificans]KYC29516.1 TonB-dependent receptor [Sterolibacterium denitrificans]SMB32099.1 TonB-dependent receptor [Sterolibacterium denitrificans]
MPQKSRIFRRRVFVPAQTTMAVMLAMGYPAHALSSEIVLPRINVVAGGEDAIVKQPGSVSIVGPADLERIQPLSTEDALRTVPGIHIKGEEESAIVANIGMRGLSAADYKSLILEDGVPVAPGLFVGNQRYYNPRIQRMEEIEVLKGAAALRYGPNTIGGVINYKTKEPIDGVSIAGRIGSHNYREATLEAGGKSPSGEAKAGLFYTRAKSDGFQGKGFDMEDLMLKGGMALGNDQWVSFKFTHHENDANISYRGLFLDAYKAGASYNPAPDDWFLTKRKSLDLNHQWEINPDTTLNTLVYWSDMSRDYWRFAVDNAASTAAGRWVYTNTVNGNNRAFERVGLDSRLTINHKSFGFNNKAEIGVRIMDEEMVDQGVTATRANPRSGTISTDRVDSATGYALFGENRFDVTDKLSITPGLRIEHYEQKRHDRQNSANDGKSSNTEYLPGIGATYWLSPGTQLYGSVYKAFSPPLNSQSIVTGLDQQLDAEKSLNIEAGIRGQSGKLRYELTVFQMDFDNQITPAISGGLTNANAGSTLHRGLETAFGYSWDNGFSLDTNLTWIPTADYREDRGGGVNKGNRLPYSPEWLANVTLAYVSGPMQVALAGRYVDEQYGHGDNTDPITGSGNNIWKGKLPSYHTFDLTGTYALSKQLKLTAAIKNLTDERYIAGLRQGIYAGAERSLEIGAKYVF